MFARLMKIPSASQAPVSGHFLNYGFNRVRFVAPVPAGSRLRGHFRTADEQPGSDKGETIVAVDVLVELEGADRPALVAQWLAAWVRD
jgi:acyl dehydratase